jgi:hypothetical protein
VRQSFIFNSFSGSFFKKGIIFCFSASFCTMNARRLPPNPTPIRLAY